MIRIVYDKNGTAYSDFMVEQIVLSLKKDDYICSSTENIIHAARVLLLEKGFDVQFEFNDEILTPNKYGALHNWPKGFCDKQMNWAVRQIKFVTDKRKKERQNNE